jgi:tetratricopeptide (TPR) repeat protein
MADAYLKNAVTSSLQLHMYSNAVFLCERLYAEKQTLDNLHMLASCYHQSNQIKTAYHFLREKFDIWRTVDDQLRAPQQSIHYLYAICCISLQLFDEAENILLQYYTNQSEEASVNYWLGVICRYTNRKEAAITYLNKALALNPLMWCAFENLAQLGENVDIQAVFNPKKVESTEQFQPQTLFNTPTTVNNTPIRTTVPFSFRTPENNTFVTPSPINPTDKVMRKKLPNTTQSKLFDDQMESPFAKSGPSPDHMNPFTPMQTQLNPIDPFQQESSDQTDLAKKTLVLISALARPYLLFCQYQCAQAIAQFQRLPQRHFYTGWVLCYVGKSYFEMAQYESAERAFENATRLEPYRLEGLEVYSTILWHLKRDTRLSHLAHHMSQIDKLSPATLCAIGNCFSLQKDHETALKFFERAVRMSPLFTYAYTLAGHEHFANDDLDEALECYRHAIRIDPRHYNAWYGLGTVYFRQEKFELAEYHFSRALSINDKSSVLYCYCGMALSASGKHGEAIIMLDKALQIHPQNPMAKFRKANALIALDKHEQALKELEELEQIAPKEASVHFTMGKISAKLGHKDRALYHYNIALDLENPAHNSSSVKEAIAKLFEEDDEHEEEEEEEEK